MNVHPFDPGPLVLPGSEDRPEGLHVSQIYGDLLKVIDPKRYKGGDLPYLKITAGLAFEQQLEKILSVQIPGGFRPPAVKRDGIWCSPDAMAMDPWRIREFKLTWYSTNKIIPTDDVYWPWRVQMMAYCWVMETQMAELWVLSVNGNYAPPAPVFSCCVLDWTMQELEENWLMLVNHAKFRGWLPSG